MQEIYAIHQSKEAKKEIDRIGEEARHQYSQWKKTLSGTMTDKQLSLGLSLLFFFYVFYASFNSISEEEFQQEDLVNCTCSKKHREYYQSLVITFCSIWIICFCLVTTWDLMRYFRVKPTSECFRWERIMDAFVKRAEEKIKEGQLEAFEAPLSPEKHVSAVKPSHAVKPQAISSQPLVSSPQVSLDRPNVLKSATLERLDHYENYLWLQFNRVYSVGAALGNHKELKLPQIKSVVADEQKIRRTSARKVSIQVNGRLVSTATDAEDEPDGRKLFAHMEEEDLPIKTADMASCSSVAFFLYPFLLSARLLAQAALIPLLILQVLDTHAWICVMHNLYCANLRSEYQLGLDRTALSFGFYCSVLISILATTMLQWFPCTKRARKAGATSIA